MQMKVSTAKNSAEGLLQFFAYEFGAVLDESLVLRAKRGREVAIDVQFAGNSVLHENRHNDFRFGLKRTSEIARILADVVDNNRLATGSGRATDALVEWNARMRSHGSHKTFQHQHSGYGTGFEYVKANPVIFQHTIVQQLANALHKGFGRGGRFRARRDFFANLLDSGLCGHKENLNPEREARVQRR